MFFPVRGLAQGGRHMTEGRPGPREKLAPWTPTRPGSLPAWFSCCLWRGSFVCLQK